ncbi:hypothetical protein JXQ70_14980 [bacterium]|nr:hypothetical protein [bacterium]
MNEPLRGHLDNHFKSPHNTNKFVTNKSVDGYWKNMSDTLKQAYGNWVEGDRFWDRKDDIKLMIQYLDESAHILLTAQRRMGKTSL